MKRMIEMLVADMQNVIITAGENEGCITPSVYDTAQVLRFYPPESGIQGGLRWLLAQQQADGGWGNPTVPQARDIPTLAAMVTLATHSATLQDSTTIERAIDAGVTFLEQQRELWQKPLSEDLPTGAEMVLIALLDDAKKLGIDVCPDAYGALRALGERKRQYIASVKPAAGTAPSYTWEVWGNTARTDILDGSGGVGHSPAATAAWLSAADEKEGLDEERAAAQRYLDGANRATGLDIPGVVPTVWPIKRFEQSWVLYSLFASNLLTDRRFAGLVEPLAGDLASAMTSHGLGMSDYFVADGDITSMTLAVLLAAGQPADVTRLHHFRNNGHFITYTAELQSSITTTAHAVLALGLAGHNVATPCRFLISQQSEDGRWHGDKWHSSWLYTTAAAVAALVHADTLAPLSKTHGAVLTAQNEDGGWGIGPSSTTAETAYALHILLMLEDAGVHTPSTQSAYARGHRWLLQHYRPFKVEATAERFWIGKELYAPSIVDRAHEISALLTLALEDDDE